MTSHCTVCQLGRVASAHQTLPRRPWFELRVATVWLFLAWERIDLARGMDSHASGKSENNNFTVNGGKTVSSTDIGATELMRICLAENDRRFAGYNQRLFQPSTTPKLMRLAQRFMRAREPRDARRR